MTRHTEAEPIARWADLIMDWEIPDNDQERFKLHQRQRRIAKLECAIYGLPYKPLPDELHYWSDL